MAAADPRWLKLARTDLGIREVPGVANNPVLMKRFASIQKALGMFYNADSVPWCGAGLAWWMTQCGIAPPAIAVRAKSWSTWGLNLRPERIAPGAVIYMSRDGGGHVTLYVGENRDFYFGLGCNQGDAITIARFPKSRVLNADGTVRKDAAIRWPKGEPVIGGPVQMNAKGVPLSASEA